MMQCKTIRPSAVAAAVAMALVLGLASGAWATTISFANATPISIPGTGTGGQANPYPSSIAVAGIVETVVDLNVTISGLSHTWPDDLYIVLEGPTGEALVLWNDAGGFMNIVGINVTFDDAALAPIPNGSFPALVSGSYQVSQYHSIPGPADTAPAPNPGFGGSLADFNGLDPNGNWNLFVYDDAAGDIGTSLSGWSLTFETQPIPEPSAALLFAVGSFVVGGTLRRRRA